MCFCRVFVEGLSSWRGHENKSCPISRPAGLFVFASDWSPRCVRCRLTLMLTWTLWVRCPSSRSVSVTQRVCSAPSGCSSLASDPPPPPPSFTSSQSDRILRATDGERNTLYEKVHEKKFELSPKKGSNIHRPPPPVSVSFSPHWSVAAYLSAKLATLSWSLGRRRTAFQNIRAGGLEMFSVTRAGRSSGSHTLSLRETAKKELKRCFVTRTALVIETRAHVHGNNGSPGLFHDFKPNFHDQTFCGISGA